MVKIDLKRKVYSDNAIHWGTIIGGPLVGSYFLYKNLKMLGKTKIANKSLLYGFTLMIIVIITIFLMPDNILKKIPNMLIPIIYTILIRNYAQNVQGNEIKQCLKEGWIKYPWWHSWLIGIPISVFTLLIFLLAYMLFHLAGII